MMITDRVQTGASGRRENASTGCWARHEDSLFPPWRAEDTKKHTHRPVRANARLQSSGCEHPEPSSPPAHRHPQVGTRHAGGADGGAGAPYGPHLRAARPSRIRVPCAPAPVGCPVDSPRPGRAVRVPTQAPQRRAKDRKKPRSVRECGIAPAPGFAEGKTSCHTRTRPRRSGRATRVHVTARRTGGRDGYECGDMDMAARARGEGGGRARGGSWAS